MDYKKDFIHVLRSIANHKNDKELFDDWLIMASSALYSFKKDKASEEYYMNIAKKYNKDSLNKFRGLLSIASLGISDENDFLGDLYTEMGLLNSRNSQYFTPYYIAILLATLNIGGSKLNNNHIYTMNDPACGSGVMSIAFINKLRSIDFDYQNNVLICAEDISSQCAMMTFIQLSCLKVPAIVACKNTLTQETYWEKETVWFYKTNIEERLSRQISEENKKDGLKNIENEFYSFDLLK